MLILATPIVAGAQTAPVRIDGVVGEWTDTPAAFTDSDEDGSAGANFRRLWIGSDANFLFLTIEFGLEIGLQENNNLSLYLDTDLDSETGDAFSGIGAELVWNFADRSGTFYAGDKMRAVEHGDIGFISAPTVTSDVFEIALELDAAPGLIAPLFPANSFRIVLADGSNGDRLPDSGQTLTLPIDRSAATHLGPVELERQLPSDIRIYTYNVETDGLFTAGFTNAHQRMLTSLAPDIMLFVEVRDHTAAQTAERVESMYPAQNGTGWYAAGAGTDIVMVSRFPITSTFRLQQVNQFGFGNRAFLVDPGDAFPHDFLIVGAHLPCCSNDSDRQLEADEIMAFIRDRVKDGTIAPETGIIITGDLNLVGDARQLTTLVSGQIVNAVFEPSFAPDWDGSDLADLTPSTTGTPFVYTWKGGSFSPGRLDFFIYSDASISVGNAFALDTSELTPDQLTRAGLRRLDTAVSDHLPVVADFRAKAETAAENETPLRRSVALIESVYPNPTRDHLTVELREDHKGRVDLLIFDVLGRVVDRKTGVAFERRGGKVTLPLSLAPGVYVLALQAGPAWDAVPFVVLHR